jgi:hypothetical protein
VNGSSPAAEQYNRAENQMIDLFLLIVIVAITLGMVGVVAKALLFIGIVVFIGALLFGALRIRRPSRGTRAGKIPILAGASPGTRIRIRGLGVHWL